MSKNKDKKISDREIISNLIEYIEQASGAYEFEMGDFASKLKFTQHNTNESVLHCQNRVADYDS